MLLMILLTIVAIIVAIQSRKTIDWGDFVSVTLIAYTLVCGLTIILSDNIVDKVKTVYPIIPINGKYFTTSIDKYGQTRYNFNYKTDNAVVANNTTYLNISKEYKVEFTYEVSKLGKWGLDFINNNDTTWAVFAPNPP